MIKQTVIQLIKKHRTNDPLEIASQRNIKVIYEQLGDTLGYFNAYKRIQMIHINTCLSVEEQRFTCAHELGHVILHPKVNTPFLRRNTFFTIYRIEREANEFAVELLMPDDLINDFRCSNTSIYAAAEAYGVPKELVPLKKIPGQRSRIY